MKRAFDVALAAAGIALTWPFMVAIAVAIRLADGGPVLYAGTRVGRHGRPFRMLKFRTMVVHADRIGGPTTAGDDPRITRTGAALREYKLDELPQLFNVLCGTMSFVGPRPEVPSEVALYSEEERVLLSVRPGITDYASIRFHDEGELLKGSPDPHEAYRRLIRPEKIRLGLEYARAPSLTRDLHILAATATALFRSRMSGRHE